MRRFGASSLPHGAPALPFFSYFKKKKSFLREAEPVNTGSYAVGRPSEQSPHGHRKTKWPLLPAAAAQTH